MNSDSHSSFRLPEDTPIDLSPAAVARYRVLAERERNKALAHAFRRLFRRRDGARFDKARSPVPAE